MVKRLASFILVLGALVCGCSRSADSDPGVLGGETHWLRPCDEDADCGDLFACHCGACTSECLSDVDCAFASEQAICTPANLTPYASACASETRICVNAGGQSSLGAAGAGGAPTTAGSGGVGGETAAAGSAAAGVGASQGGAPGTAGTAGNPTGIPVVCTQAGCEDVLTVEFFPSAEGHPLEGSSFEVAVDGGAPFLCAPRPMGQGACEDSFRTRLVDHQLECMPQEEPDTCQFDDSPAFTLTLYSAPEQIRIVYLAPEDPESADARDSKTYDLQPEYETLMPNGPQCEPTCKNGVVEVALPPPY